MPVWTQEMLDRCKAEGKGKYARFFTYSEVDPDFDDGIDDDDDSTIDSPSVVDPSKEPTDTVPVSDPPGEPVG